MENKTITLGELIQCVSLADVHILDMDEEHEVATIVELTPNTLTELGKERFKEVLKSRVVRVYNGYYGTQIEITRANIEDIEDFQFCLAGNCNSKDFNRWFNLES